MDEARVKRDGERGGQEDESRSESGEIFWE